MTFGGPIYRTTSTYWPAPYIGPPQGTAVGVGALSFRDSQTGTLNFIVDGVRTIKPLARFPIE